MRAFIALELPDSFRFQVAGLARCLEARVKGRFGTPENYHVTLAFLGDASEREVRLAMDAIDDVGVRAKAVPVECAGLGKFGKPRDATLWLGLRENDALMQLAADVREALSAREVPFDGKAFKPHVTIARRASISKGALSDLSFPAPDCALAVTLFKSQLSADGPTYTPLHSVPLPSSLRG